MGSDVAIREDSPVPNVMTNEQLKYIANTEFVPKGLRNNLPAILACVATGRAIGIDDMTAIRSIHIIDGKPTFSAELMVMLVRRRGHSITGDVGPEGTTVTGTRADNGDTMTSTWTLDMAKRAGLANKGNWKSYPEAMLWARAVSQLCRMLFADCFAGGTYTAEELGDLSPPAVEPVDVDVDDNLFLPINSETGEIIEAGEDSAGKPLGGDDALASGDEGASPVSPAEATPAVISEPQRKRLRAIQTRAGVTDEALKAMVLDVAGVESSKLIPVAKYDELVEKVETGGSEFARGAAVAMAGREATEASQ